MQNWKMKKGDEEEANRAGRTKWREKEERENEGRESRRGEEKRD